jgi:hypothetical protein
MEKLIFTGPPGEQKPAQPGAIAVDGPHGLELFSEYIAATGDEDCGDMDVVAKWIEQRYGKSLADGWTWRSQFAF